MVNGLYGLSGLGGFYKDLDIKGYSTK